MQGRADTAGEAMSVHSQHFREDTGSSHSSPLTMAKQIQCEQPFHANQYFPVLLSQVFAPRCHHFFSFPFRSAVTAQARGLNVLFLPALIPHHPVITASSIRGVSPCCFHQDLGCAILNFLLTGLKKQWLYIHTES